jgi:hypothetical protein
MNQTSKPIGLYGALNCGVLLAITQNTRRSKASAAGRWTPGGAFGTVRDQARI